MEVQFYNFVIFASGQRRVVWQGGVVPSRKSGQATVALQYTFIYLTSICSVSCVVSRRSTALFYRLITDYIPPSHFADEQC